VQDILTTGEQKLKSSTLGTFNKKVQGMITGQGFEEDVNELPSVTLDVSTDNMV
jgi:hypothetical protein